MSMQTDKQVLVTGANGLLGQKVVDAFKPHFSVIATGLEKQSVRSIDPASYQRLDLTDHDQLKDCFDEYRPDIVVNCAAYTDVDGAENEKETAWQVNALAVKRMVRILRRMGTKFVQISTDYIFSGEDGPYDESARPEPVNYYGTSKLAAENEIKASGIDHVIFRTNVLYGAAESITPNFVLWVMKSLEENEPIQVVDDQINNATLANGLAECIAIGCVMNAKGVYNYAGTDLINRYEFALKIADYFGYNVDLISPCKTKDLNQTAERPLRSGLLTDKVVKNLHIQLYDTEAGLQQVEKDLQQCEI
ncbi:MAG: dTDP-4-dehydrorhamnose reductase [Candidatus Marinimicrobia bacterium]|nr:dTDP-4-dehydrorhamnose reductase [Candidatus Neomarinimicrobiota bacterium]MCF7880224.1 dTDP-4-dehydrorhamnose reductase [Candidatus Neomarinimicrobiota bacterium]